MLDDGSVYVLEYGNTLSQISYDSGPVVTLEGGLFLQGPYEGGGEMDTTLLDGGDLPHLQPYLDSAFKGTVNEFGLPVWVDQVPPGAVDWILAELRSGPTAASRVDMQTGFLYHDGTILGVDGETGIHFPMIDSSSYYVVIRHRNHLPIMSADPIEFSSGVGTWDTRTTSSSTYTDGAVALADLGEGRFGLFGGDVDTDGQVIATDFNDWLTCTKMATTGYLNPDWNLDAHCLANDFNLWLINTKAARSSQVPE